jgi:hypothetical protein
MNFKNVVELAAGVIIGMLGYTLLIKIVLPMAGISMFEEEAR